MDYPTSASQPASDGNTPRHIPELAMLADLRLKALYERRVQRGLIEDMEIKLKGLDSPERGLSYLFVLSAETVLCSAQRAGREIEVLDELEMDRRTLVDLSLPPATAAGRQFQRARRLLWTLAVSAAYRDRARMHSA